MFWLFFIFAAIYNVYCDDWGYAGTTLLDPYNWKNVYPNCGGREQSPVNLDTLGPEVIQSFPVNPLSFSPEYFSKNGVTGLWTINGHTAVFSPIDASALYMTGGFYEENIFEFFQMHLHWGCSDKIGSEHLIDGQSTSMELHMVHWNTYYQSFSEASTQKDGLAVIAILFNATDHFHNNSNFDIIKTELNLLTSALEKLSISSTSVKLEHILSNFLLEPIEKLEYFWYKGSLTTPGCNEVVSWTVMATVLPVERRQLKILRNLANSETEKLCNNFRPTQEMGERKVKINFGPNLP